jgi:hypothetical protein
MADHTNALRCRRSRARKKYGVERVPLLRAGRPSLWADDGEPMSLTLLRAIRQLGEQPYERDQFGRVDHARRVA